MKRLLLVLALLVWGGAGALPAQTSGVRFEILQAGDSTLTFAQGNARWLREGLMGIAVDPTRRDVVVATFRIRSVDRGSVNAIITGQVTRVTADHVAIMDPPPSAFFRSMIFWSGLIVGFALGAFVGSTR